MMNGYQMISSVDELPQDKLYRYNYPSHVKVYWRIGSDFYADKIIWKAGTSPFSNESAERERKKIDGIVEYEGITRKEVYSILLELFDGRQGFYVADLKKRHYFHFCDREALKEKLEELSIKAV